MRHELQYVNCPICNKQLIDLADTLDNDCGYHYYWCDQCQIDIRIEEENYAN